MTITVTMEDVWFPPVSVASTFTFSVPGASNFISVFPSSKVVVTSVESDADFTRSSTFSVEPTPTTTVSFFSVMDGASVSTT